MPLCYHLYFSDIESDEQCLTEVFLILNMCNYVLQ